MAFLEAAKMDTYRALREFVADFLTAERSLKSNNRGEGSSENEPGTGTTETTNPPRIPRRCYSCNEEGHLSRTFPKKAATNEVCSGEQTTLAADLAYLNLSCGEVTLPRGSGDIGNGIVGATTELSVHIFGTQFRALVDSGSNVSLISARVLAALERNELWVNKVKENASNMTIPLLELEKICLADAQRNPMKPMAGLRLSVKLRNRAPRWIEFLVVDRPVDELLLGTNAFQRQG